MQPMCSDYASSRAGNLRKHLKTHSGEKLNKCNKCDYASSETGLVCHKISENIWFVWSKRSYSGQKVGCDDCDTRKCEDSARILEAGFATSKEHP